jgi:hypothetical protein
MQTCQPEIPRTLCGRCDWIAVSYSAASYVTVFFTICLTTIFSTAVFFLIDIVSY